MCIWLQVLKDYLINNECADIIRDYENKNTLTDSSRRRLVAATVNLIRKNFGNYPTKEEKTSAAKAIIHLFPSFKTEGKFGGIVSNID